jgi:FixJ family two-component response regulator
MSSIELEPFLSHDQNLATLYRPLDDKRRWPGAGSKSSGNSIVRNLHFDPRGSSLEPARIRMEGPMEPTRLGSGVAASSVHAPAHVHVIDDDLSVRTAIVRLVRAEGFAATGHPCAESFLEVSRPQEHGCIVLDFAMPGLDGLALQRRLAERGSHMPIIFLTGQADVPMCAQAMKQGAFDFLTKPVDDAVLLAAVSNALATDLLLGLACEERMATERLLATLTPREREVLTHVMAGRLNKQIAADLGTAEKTVKVHRARGMEKMHVRSVADLVRIVERARPHGTDTPAPRASVRHWTNVS